MDITAFFQPATVVGTYRSDALGAAVLPAAAWASAGIVLIGVPAPGSNALVAHEVRQQLYPLMPPNACPRWADLGDLRPRDAGALDEVLAYVLEQLRQAGKTAILLADQPEQSFGVYLSYAAGNEAIDYVHVAPDFALRHKQSDEAGYNRKIFSFEPNRLHAFTHLGYQRYFVSEAELDTLRDLHFATLRYGELQEKPGEAEPAFRDAHMAVMDLSAMRRSAFPAALQPSPGGFSTTEICQLARYAGASARLNSLLLTGLNPVVEDGGASAQVMALTVWYALEGAGLRRDAHPAHGGAQFRRYEVQRFGATGQMVFARHQPSGNWWMEAPRRDDEPVSWIACTASDYESARQGEIPPRWWLAQQRLD